MVKVCERHKHELQDGCTYEVVESGIISIKSNNIPKFKESDCEICIKLMKLHNLTDLICREMKSLGLAVVFAEERREIFCTLNNFVDWKIREHC